MNPKLEVLLGMRKPPVADAPKPKAAPKTPKVTKKTAKVETKK